MIDKHREVAKLNGSIVQTVASRLVGIFQKTRHTKELFQLSERHEFLGVFVELLRGHAVHDFMCRVCVSMAI